MSEELTRRRFMKGMVIAATGAMIGACAPKTVVVTKEVEKIVKETVLVEKEVTRVVEKTAVTEKSAARPGGWVPKIPAPPKKYDPLVHVRTYGGYYASVLPEGDTRDQNPWSRYLDEQMGIHYDFMWEFEGHQTAKLDLAIASGELPDYFVCAPKTLMTQLQEGGLVEDITDIWNATASPLLKQRKEYPTHGFWPPCFIDGRLYGIAYLNGPDYGQEPTLWIRKDWLDKVGLEPPKTFDDVEAIATAFVKEGLCPIGLWTSEYLLTQLGSLSWVFGAYGVVPIGYAWETWWMKDGKGGVIAGPVVAPAEPLAIIRDWYAKGLLAKDWFTMQMWQNPGGIAYWTGGQTGMVACAWWFGSMMAATKQNDPEADIIDVTVPYGPNGKRGREASLRPGEMSFFKKGIDPTKIEAVINHMNWIVDRYEHPSANYDYGYTSWHSSQGTHEGYEWKWEGDKIVAGDYQIVRGGAEAPNWWYPGMKVVGDRNMDEIAAKPAEQWNAFERFVMKDPWRAAQTEAYKHVYESRDITIRNEVWLPATSDVEDAGKEMEKLCQQYYTDVIIGKQSLDDLDKFKQEWLDRGGAELTELANKYYLKDQEELKKIPKS